MALQLPKNQYCLKKVIIKFIGIFIGDIAGMGDLRVGVRGSIAGAATLLKFAKKISKKLNGHES